MALFMTLLYFLYDVDMKLSQGGYAFNTTPS